MARRSLIGWMADLDPAQEHRLAVWISETFPFIPWLLERINKLVSRG